MLITALITSPIGLDCHFHSQLATMFIPAPIRAGCHVNYRANYRVNYQPRSAEFLCPFPACHDVHPCPTGLHYRANYRANYHPHLPPRHPHLPAATPPPPPFISSPN